MKDEEDKPKLKDPGRTLSSSSAPLTAETVQEQIQKQKELIEYAQQHGDLPVDWPFCSYKGNKGLEYLGFGFLEKPFVEEKECVEIAAWAIQLDYSDRKSEIALLCTKHFTLLPTKPDGSLYRIFKLTVRNYATFITSKR